MKHCLFSFHLRTTSYVYYFIINAYFIYKLISINKLLIIRQASLAFVFCFYKMQLTIYSSVAHR